MKRRHLSGLKTNFGEKFSVAQNTGTVRSLESINSNRLQTEALQINRRSIPSMQPECDQWYVGPPHLCRGLAACRME